MPSPLNVFQFRMPTGFPGDVNRAEIAHIETNLIDSGTPPTAFGLPCKLVSGKVQPMGASDVAASLYGFNVRAFPSGQTATDGLGTTTPPTSGITDILRRGYIVVQLNGATAAAKGGTVYIRVANASAGKPIGGIEAASDSTNTIALSSNTTFNGAADAYGNVEIAFNV